MSATCVGKVHLQEFAKCVGILENLAKQEKIASNSLPTNLVFLGTWQILPLRRAYMRARKRFGIAVSVVSATLGRRRSTYRAAASSSTSRSLLLQLVTDDAGRRRPLRTPDRRLHPREAEHLQQFVIFYLAYLVFCQLLKRYAK